MPTYRATKVNNRRDYIFMAESDKLALDHWKEKFPNGGSTLYTSSPNGMIRIRKLAHSPKVKS